MIRTAGKDDSRATVDQTADGVSPLRARMWTARKKEGRRCGRRLRRKVSSREAYHDPGPGETAILEMSFIFFALAISSRTAAFAFRLSLVDDLEAAR
ncbi:hypothetical protein PC117_g17485 [Phytophthora cactorum]|uniref:Uncharacterized protein n=2 Tax=Phytophthora cactorum TaxID=29920 RepID=A0A8T1C7J1_9STRA|nr:hypothetical protein PC117_g17485 [Phytophthora cactorum]